MAFRKTVRGLYVPPVSFHLFGEFKDSPSMHVDGSTFMSTRFHDCSSLSDDCFPLMSVKDIVNSGQVISGSVSFARTDPAMLERDVHSAVTSFISSNSPTHEN